MRLIAPALAVCLLALLTGCDPTGSGPTPPPSAESGSPIPTTEPTDAVEVEPEPATILLRTASFSILDDEQAVLFDFDYFDPPTEAISALTQVFGGAPVVTPYEGDSHQWPGSYYTWDAFTLVDYDGPAIAYGEDFGVAASAAVVRGLDVETVNGLTVGATATAAAAAGGVLQTFDYAGTSATWYQLDIVAGTDPEWAEWDGGPRIFVNAAMSGSGGTVTVLSAPVANYGP